MFGLGLGRLGSSVSVGEEVASFGISLCPNICRRREESGIRFRREKDMAKPLPYYFFDFALPQPLAKNSAPLTVEHLHRRVTHSSRIFCVCCNFGRSLMQYSFSFAIK